MGKVIRAMAWNIAGYRSKKLEVVDLFESCDADVLFLSETWCPPDYQARLPELAVSHGARSEGDRGRYSGGVALIVNPKRQHLARAVRNIRRDPVGRWISWDMLGFSFSGLYLGPSASLEECISVVTEVCSNREFPLVLCGDLNMRIGTLANDSVTNARGRELLPIIESFGLKLCQYGPKLPTFESSATDGQSSVDYFFGPTNTDPIVCNICEDLRGSDHRPIWIEVQSVLPVPQTLPARRALNLGKLRDPEIKDMFERFFANNYQDSLERRGTMLLDQEALGQGALDEWEKSLRTGLEESAEAILGSHKVKPPQLRYTDSEELKRMRCKRDALSKSLRKMKPGPKKDAVRAMYLAELAEIRQVTRRLQERQFSKWADELDNSPAPDITKTVARINRARTGRGGSSLIDSPEALEQYRAHFAKQFTLVDPEMTVEPPTATHRGFAGVATCDVARAIRSMPNGKAPGVSGLKAEVIKAAGEAAVTCYADLFCACLKFGMIPTPWKTARIVPIPKVAGTSKISEHRPISLTEVPRKIFEKVVMKQLLEVVEPLDVSQGGFRARRSVLDQVMSLNEILIQRNRIATPPIVVFLDIKAAYDSVDRRILWRKLADKGASAVLLTVLQALFDQCCSTVAVLGQDSGLLTHEAGLLQGSIISPVLYSLFVNDLAPKIRQVSSVSFDGSDRAGGSYLIPGSFFYADDIAIVGRDVEEVRRQLAVCEVHSKENNYLFNPKKCKYVAPQPQQIALYGTEVERVDSFVYLGVDFDFRGALWKQHFARRIRKASDTVKKLRGCGFHGFGLGERTNLMAYKALVRPSLEFGLAAMPPIKAVFKMLDKAQLGFLKLMLSLPKSACGNAIRVICALPSFWQRHTELRARRLNAIERRGKFHMCANAYRAAKARSPECARSCFRGWNSNVILQRYRQEWLLAGLRKESPPSLDDLIIQERVQHLEWTRTRMARRGAWRVAPDAKPGLLYSLCRVTKRDRRMVLTFVTQCLFWTRLSCKKCGGKLTYTHLLDCADVRAAQDWCRIGRMKRSAALLRLGVETCRPENG